MKELVIFCEAYVVIEDALYVATHNRDNCSITIVIPGNHDLFKFFQVVNERLFHNSMNLIYFEVYSDRRAKASKIKKFLHLLPDIIGERIYLNRIFGEYLAELEGAEVYFLARYMNKVTFYLVKMLAKRNKLVYMYYAPYTEQAGEYTPRNIVDLMKLVRLKLICGRDIALGRLPYTKGFSYIPDRFLKKEVSRVIDREERNEMMKGFDLSQLKIFDVSDYNIIYFDQDVTGYISDSTAFQRELAEIFNILNRHFPAKEIACKYHPKHHHDKSRMPIGDVLPDFIPAEFLYNGNVKMYLGLFSNAIANVEKGLAVSILDLITFKDKEIRERLKETLIQRRHSEILFPKSLDEFEKILIDIKEPTT